MQSNGRLRVLDQILVIAREVGVIVKRVKPRDPDLADQLRRAWTSAANNASEAQHQRGAKRLNRYDDAMGSAREARTAILLAEAYGHCPAATTAPLARRMDGVVAQLYRLAHPR